MILSTSKKIAVGIIGGVVTLIGIVLVPYPGPGWLIVFAGLAILSTEFAFAQRLLDRLKAKYHEWTQWLKAQPWWIQLLSLGFTVLVVLLTLYLLNTFGILNSFFDLELDWLVSPFFW